jgi:hypothetical protein
MKGLGEIIEHIRAMRADMEEFEAKMLLSDMRRAAEESRRMNTPIMDEFATVDSFDFLEMGAFK